MTEQQEEQTLDRKDLKIMAYKEKLAELEESNADLRVDLTILSQQLQELQTQQTVTESADATSQDEVGNESEAV